MLDQYADRWALVTGASSGIGAEFARRLAALGMHLVLVARRGERLSELSQELYAKHHTRCELIAADLSIAEDVARVVREVESRGLAIELLVNNAGFSVVSEIERTDVDRLMQMIHLNIDAVTQLTYHFLSPMLERGHGAIINVSSVTAFQPVAYMGAYAATKSYILHMTEALWSEARDRGVTLMALCPGTTRTELFDKAGVPGWLKKQRSHEPDRVVRGALRALEKRKQYYIPGFRNYFVTWLVRIATRRTVVKESMKYFRPGRPQPQAAPVIEGSISEESP